MLLGGKRILVMGLLDTKSLAWTIGEMAAMQGAEVIYTVQSQRFRDSLLRRSFKQEGLDINDYCTLPCDVTNDDEIKALFQEVGGGLDGLVHSIGYANPDTCLQGRLGEAPRADILKALEISAASLPLMAEQAFPVMNPGGSIVAMSFASQMVFPNYNWMGVCKAALEAAARYVARDLAPMRIRVNCISAGPQNTTAATRIPGFVHIGKVWPAKAPLGWDLDEGRFAVASSALYLLSDLAQYVTGEVIHVDGGFHFMGMTDPTRLQEPEQEQEPAPTD